MWPFKKVEEPKPKTAFRMRYIISGFEMPARTIANTSELTKKNIEYISQNIDQYRSEVKQQYSTNGMPDCQLHNLEESEVLEDGTEIVAEFIFTYEEEEIPQHSQVGKVMVGLGLMSVVGLVGVVLMFVGMEYKHEQKRKRIPACAIQYLEDKPYSIVVGTSEYKLNEDGTMPREERMFLNPWHQEVINKGNCVRVDLQKEFKNE